MKKQIDRRSFLQLSSTALVGSTLASQAIGAQETPRPSPDGSSEGHGDAEVRLALIGCGGRGTGATANALSTSGKVKLVAMADAFEDRLASSLENLSESFEGKVDVPPERRFVGFDAYSRAIESGVDMVILATPPGFRPIHFDHAVAKGCHVFMEKPVAVDGPGVAFVLGAAEKAKEQGLKVGVGLQRRHSPKYIETVRRIRDGALGKLRLLRAYWNGGGVWVRPRKEGMTEMEYQMRNWYYFNWLCGDHITEQHIHNLDVCNWIMDGYPVRAQGQGGRLIRTGIDHGEIFDHHFVEFTYADGTTMLSQCRHMPGCTSNVSEHATGARGHSNIGAGRLVVDGGWDWRYEGEQVDPYQREHDDLFAAIREGAPYNEAEYGAMSTLTSVMGRMATYSGKVVSLDAALGSDVSLLPERFAWDANPPTLPDAEGRYPIPVPGVTKAF